MVERGGLENRCPLGDRGFESLTLCKTKAWYEVLGFSFLMRWKQASISRQKTKDRLAKQVCPLSLASLYKDRDPALAGEQSLYFA